MSTDVEDVATASTLERGFDFTDGGGSFADEPTELPEPWSPPPDPDFATGTIPKIDPADLSEGLVPHLEPSDSVQMTTRLSREDVRALVAARIQASTMTHEAAAPPVPAPPRLPAGHAVGPAQPPVFLPPAAMAAIPALPAPGMRLVIAYRWQLYHVAIAFAIGVLTGVLAMR